MSETTAVRFVEIGLAVPETALGAVLALYGDRVGETRLRFTATSGSGPFYHFALLVPGDRFDAARAWADDRFELLPDSETGEVVFDFSDWDALACYFHDPAGNIVELIAHRDIGALGRRGRFAWDELLGVSELGLVGEPRDLYASLHAQGLELWDGTLDEPGRLAFVGEKGRTLILAPPGRGWLPTGRPAEPHPVQAELATGARRITISV